MGLHTASTAQGVDFDRLGTRSNKKTGEQITAEYIVKGIAYDDGEYVVIPPAKEADSDSAEVIDLTVLLQRSLKGMKNGGAALSAVAPQRGSPRVQAAGTACPNVADEAPVAASL